VVVVNNGSFIIMRARRRDSGCLPVTHFLGQDGRKNCLNRSNHRRTFSLEQIC